MRCGIVGMGTGCVEADQGVTPTIAHAPTRIVHGLRPVNAGLEKVPDRVQVERLLPAGQGSAAILAAPLPAAGVAAEEGNIPPSTDVGLQVVAHRSRPVLVMPH